MGTAPRLLIAVTVVAMLVWMGSESLRNGMAGSVAANGAAELDRTARAPGLPIAGTWWLADLRRVSGEVPKDPLLHELLALAILRGGGDAGELLEAERHLVSAIEARAGSPYTWANLVEAKYRMGETGAAFEKALVNAASLGPYEPEVQRVVVDYGLAVMDQVAPATRAAVEHAVAAGMFRNPPEILQIAARRGRLNVACRHLDGIPRPADSKWTKLCQSMEATP